MPFTMTQIQEPRQRQEQRLTQKQKQSLEVLTMPQAKLEELIRGELPENPFLEIEAWNTYLNQHAGADYAPRRSQEDDPFLEVQQSLAKRPSLIEHLTRQLCESRLSREEISLGEHIIGNLDGNGYLAISLEELTDGTGMTPQKIESVLKRIQNFDPVGVAARSARECLLVQLEHGAEGGGLAARIVATCLEELAAKRFGEIAARLAVSISDVQQAHKRIASLEPKPARAFDCEQVRIAIPEVVVERADGKWQVTLAETDLPRLRVNQRRYLWQISHLSREQQDLRKNLQTQFQVARQLFQAIDDRHKTLLAVATAMFERQKAFLDLGRCWVKPMVMKDIGEEIGVNESTVSRAVSDKFARTPHGIFPLRFFFQDSVPRKVGAPVSSEYVKSKIRALVAAEDRRNPLTDDEIVQRLGGLYAIKMARRTVNKYRESLKIPPAKSRQREAESVLDP